MNTERYYSTFENLSVTNCPTSKTVGSIVSISSTAVGGTAPYEVIIKKDGGEIYHTTKTILENTPVSTTYTIQTTDAGKTITLSSYIIDSCLPTNQTSTTELCSFSVPSACPTLTCTLNITPTTITSGEYITITSTAIGGQGSASHIIYKDEYGIYNTGPGWGSVFSASMPLTTPGTYEFYSIVDDQCTPPQRCTSSTIIITVNAAGCPALTCSLNITPTTITLGEYVTFTSTAIGGQGAADHSLYMDGNGIYGTGPGWGSVSSASIKPTTSGTHTLYTIVHDECTPFQECTSSTVTITVNAAACPLLSCNFSVT